MRGVGRSRSGDEREQTLNQILCELDGFEGREQIIVLAATNRADALDTALMRPGRFDRQIPLTLPTTQGRQQILEVHAVNRKFADDVDLADVAEKSAGFSGAQLGNVINESALLAVRRQKESITQGELDD